MGLESVAMPWSLLCWSCRLRSGGRQFEGVPKSVVGDPISCLSSIPSKLGYSGKLGVCAKVVLYVFRRTLQTITFFLYDPLSLLS